MQPAQILSNLSQKIVSQNAPEVKCELEMPLDMVNRRIYFAASGVLLAYKYVLRFFADDREVFILEGYWGEHVGINTVLGTSLAYAPFGSTAAGPDCLLFHAHTIDVDTMMTYIMSPFRARIQANKATITLSEIVKDSNPTAETKVCLAVYSEA